MRLTASLCFLALAICSPPTSAADFDKHLITPPAHGDIRVIRSVDLDGDGQLDMVCAGYGGIHWSPGGSGTSMRPLVSDLRVAADDGGNSMDTLICFSDLDRDGDLDLLVAIRDMIQNTDSSRIVWFANHGNGVFGASRLLTAEVQIPSMVDVADLNGDSIPDIIVSSNMGLFWFPNNGSGIFPTTPNLISQSYHSGYIHAADIDGDGDIDIVGKSSGADGISWFANDGSGGFGPERNVATADNVAAVTTEDLNLDGFPDIAAAVAGDGTIRLYLSSGPGTYGQAIILANGFYNPRSLRTADLDADGDQDIIFTNACFSCTNGLNWLKNQGGGTFSPISALSSSRDDFGTIDLADFDGDSHVDILAADAFGIRWMINNGNAVFSRFEIESADTYRPRLLLSADINGDNLVDLLSATSKSDKDIICWQPGLPGGGFGSLIPLDGAISRPDALKVEDLDRDGRKDIVSISYASLQWYRNLGGNAFSSCLTITSAISGKGTTGDFDNDGDIDVVGMRTTNGSLVLLKNNGAAAFSAPIVIDAANLGFDIRLATADLDGDLNLDIVYGKISGEIGWYANDGTGNFTLPGRIINPLDIPPTGGDNAGFIVVDLDQDGDPDIVSTSLIHGLYVLWNNRAAGFSRPTQLSATNKWRLAIQAFDVDGDGDTDLVSSSSVSRRIWFHENLGTTAFAPEVTVSDSVSSPTGLTAADVDLDGILDLLSASLLEREVAWYKYNKEIEPARPVLHSFKHWPGETTIRWRTAASRSYSIWHSADLSNWAPAGEAKSRETGWLEYLDIDRSRANGTSGFYRLSPFPE